MVCKERRLLRLNDNVQLRHKIVFLSGVRRDSKRGSAGVPMICMIYCFCYSRRSVVVCCVGHENVVFIQPPVLHQPHALCCCWARGAVLLLRIDCVIEGTPTTHLVLQMREIIRIHIKKKYVAFTKKKAHNTDAVVPSLRPFLSPENHVSCRSTAAGGRENPKMHGRL